MHWVWNKIRRELRIWRLVTRPELTVLLLIILARLMGILQGLEWELLDMFLRWLPPEPRDERVVIVGITEDDIAQAQRYPIPDSNIAQLLTKLSSYQPRAIGLDIFKNVPVEPGHNELIQTFKQNENIIGIEKVLRSKIAPPPNLHPQQVGFVDILRDEDGKNRRYLLFTPHPDDPKNPEEDRNSLALQLAIIFLETEGIELDDRNTDTIQFGKTELPRFTPNSGGYVGTNDGGLQVLINFRRGKEPFRTFTLGEILRGNPQPEWFRNKIILIGNISPSAGDSVYTAAISGLKVHGEIYGVQYHAHAVSQILSTVLDRRPMLRTWDDWQEYIWIIIWGIVPIIIGRITQSVWKNLLGVGFAGICLIGSGYVCLLLGGWWIPIVPNLLAINGVWLSAFVLYQHEKLLRSKLDERQRTIEHTFTVIHNGPLQTLAYALRHLRVQDLPHEQLVWQFEKLNYEIREIGEYLKIEALTQEESLRLGSGLKLDLKRPIHELFYEVYTSTLERKDLEYLKNLKVKIRTFDPIDDKYLNIEQKCELCQFLEETLCNVGKHAYGVKRIQASGTYCDGCYTLRIQDNGSGINSFAENKGTKQSQNLAKKLGGQFKREPHTPRGTLCELTWTLIPNPPRSNSIQQQLKLWFFKSFRVP